VSIPIAKIVYDGDAFFSPFSGRPVFSARGVRKEASLLFCYEGEVGEWEHVSDRVTEALKAAKAKPATESSPAAVCRKLSIPGAICFELDAGWNGVRWLAFAPPGA
jgi:hypothetical protein